MKRFTKARIFSTIVLCAFPVFLIIGCGVNDSESSLNDAIGPAGSITHPPQGEQDKGWFVDHSVEFEDAFQNQLVQHTGYIPEKNCVVRQILAKLEWDLISVYEKTGSKCEINGVSRRYIGKIEASKYLVLASIKGNELINGRSERRGTFKDNKVTICHDRDSKCTAVINSRGVFCAVIRSDLKSRDRARYNTIMQTCGLDHEIEPLPPSDSASPMRERSKEWGKCMERALEDDLLRLSYRTCQEKEELAYRFDITGRNVSSAQLAKAYAKYQRAHDRCTEQYKMELERRCRHFL